MLQIGDRVQIPAWTDVWMRGDRFGTVTKLGTAFVHVAMDRSGRTYTFSAESLTQVDTR